MAHCERDNGPEIEVTEEMVDAGCRELAISDSCDPPWSTVTSVYQAMEAARRQINSLPIARTHPPFLSKCCSDDDFGHQPAINVRNQQIAKRGGTGSAADFADGRDQGQ
jgi:hypothetical protein